MGTLYGVLKKRLKSNAQNAIEVFARELPEYLAATSDQQVRAIMMDFGTAIRQCTLDRAAGGHGLTGEDLAMIQSAGAQRAENRLSLASQRHVIGLNTSLMVREIHEAATATDTDDLLHLMGWLGRQGPRARDVYLQGYLSAVGRSWSVPARIGLLARTLLADEPVVPLVDNGLHMRLASWYLVVVVRLCDRTTVVKGMRERVVESLVARWKVPMDWTDQAEFTVLIPATEAEPAATGGRPVAEPVWDSTVELVRSLAAAVGQRCAAGAVLGAAGALADPLTLAQRISRAAPPERVPGLHTLADTFVQLGVAGDPHIDSWLGAVADKLVAGPDLVRTLDAFYRHDMARVDAAAAVRIHPRTLDYRLQRVRDLVGVHPGSTQGVRVLTAAIARMRARGKT